jgi:hypothetical protein
MARCAGYNEASGGAVGSTEARELDHGRGGPRQTAPGRVGSGPAATEREWGRRRECIT